jgi:chromosome segregation ATPase
MRHTILVIAFLLVAAFAVGCKSTDGKSAAETKQRENAAAQLDKAKTETKEAAQAVQDYAYAQKTEFVEKMKKELVEIQEELDRLSAKVERSSAAAKADAKVKLEAVREKWAQAKKQLDQAESATESTWDDVKGGFKKLYGELKDSFDKTRQWLSDKIEP